MDNGQKNKKKEGERILMKDIKKHGVMTFS